jgi:Fe-S-cluster containining protein
MTAPQDNGAEDFFVALRTGFGETIRAGRGDPRLVEVLAAQAIEVFERNAEIQAEGQPTPACRRGCSACCALEVAATAPEIFLAARFVRLTAPAFAAHGVDFAPLLADFVARVKGMDQQARFASGLLCPFVIGGACAIYSARTLACRGHVGFDRAACEAAARGEDVDATLSAAHKTVRALAQGALQAALRDNGMDWGACDFLVGLDRALQDPDAEARWLRGEKVFADLWIVGEETAPVAID